MKRIHIIILIVVLIAIIATVAIVTMGGSKEENKVSGTPTQNVESLKPNVSNQAQTTKVASWDNYKVIIDGTEIKLPIKYADFINKGFYAMTKDTEEDMTQSGLNAKNSRGTTTLPGRSTRQGDGLFTNGKTSNISLILYNNTDEFKTYNECYVVGIGFYNDTVRYIEKLLGEVKIINVTKNVELTIGKSTKSEIELTFGRHSKSDASNKFNYYPDTNFDGVINLSDASVLGNKIGLDVDIETGILTNDFEYIDFGSLKE